MRPLASSKPSAAPVSYDASHDDRAAVGRPLAESEDRVSRRWRSELERARESGREAEYRERQVRSRVDGFEMALVVLDAAAQSEGLIPRTTASGGFGSARQAWEKARRRWKELERAIRKCREAGGDVERALGGFLPGLLPGPFEMAMESWTRLHGELMKSGALADGVLRNRP
jgi:hypothetical protein